MTARLSVALGMTLAVLLVWPAATEAQGSFGIGPRITFVRGAGSPDGAQRFSGGAIRLGGGKTALEVGMDFRSDVTGDLTERIKDYPIQASLLLFPVRAGIAPYLVAGAGWYSQRVEPLGPLQAEAQTTRKMGYHAGFGGELRVTRRVGLHGDYRYTLLRFGGDDDERTESSSSSAFVERLRMSHEGSAFTWGATFYF